MRIDKKRWIVMVCLECGAGFKVHPISLYQRPKDLIIYCPFCRKRTKEIQMIEEEAEEVRKRTEIEEIRNDTREGR